ncbi:MAG: ATP-binding protein [Saccharofermentans sp.]|jgi:two-component system phosphate regulon sensor histidine kinase PhoR|nr:ATP-binding protein [Mageeibacillus sp.]MCI1264186.1 ATP-binding protein [Saccharofermentans sp.]MCI1274605.1 ATP-binding protein [Saccharofermentans sp.]MCI1768698.1 ATP-binding protein [Mageeibacillus sp.]
MTERIFKSILTASLIVFLVAYLAVIGVLYQYFSKVKESDLKTMTLTVAAGVEEDGQEYLDSLDISGTNTRVTWINSDGTVIYDNWRDPSSMENHLERQEVQEAIRSGYGEASRYSSTLTQRLLYAARLLPDGTIIRLSVTQRSVIMLIFGMVQPALLIVLIAVILSVVLAHRLASHVVKPLNSLNLDFPLENEGYDELSPLFRRLSSQQLRLKEQEDELERRRQELDVILENMREGIILLGQNGRIITINASACRILELSDNPAGLDILEVSRNLALHALIAKARDGEVAVQNIDVGQCVYRVNASPVTDNGHIRGVALLMSDVTDQVNSENLRREFTSNVSHELKTPLHSIAGYSELLQNNIAADEDRQAFAGIIHNEAVHMMDLINDIIKLSHLDEGVPELKEEDIILRNEIESCTQSLKVEAEKKNVSVDVDCAENISVRGIPQFVREIIHNLMDNAIKYNTYGGSVTVSAYDAGGKCVLTVSDTGIGIPAHEQARVFERFYRVDKSHTNPDVNGTGLGLAIVKHACEAMNAEIKLLSRTQADDNGPAGTRISITFRQK